MYGESLRELVQPGGAADHHAVVGLLHHLVHGAFELLGLPDPDLNPCVLSQAWPTEQSNLLFFFIIEYNFSFLSFIMCSVFSSSVLSIEWNSNLATGTGDSLHLQFISSNRFNNLSLDILKSKDTTMVIIKDHDSCHVGGSELTRSLCAGYTIIASHINLTERHAILATKIGNADVEVLILLKHIVIQNFKSNHFLGLTRAKSQGSSCFNIVTLTASSAIFSFVVNLDCGVQITTLSDNGNLKSANRLHNSIMRRVKHDASDSIILLFVLHSQFCLLCISFCLGSLILSC